LLLLKITVWVPAARPENTCGEEEETAANALPSILISRVPPPPNAALTDPSLAPLHVASVGVRVRVKVFGCPTVAVEVIEQVVALLLLKITVWVPAARPENTCGEEEETAANALPSILISRVPPPPNAALTEPSLAPLHVASVGVSVRVKVFGCPTVAVDVIEQVVALLLLNITVWVPAARPENTCGEEEETAAKALPSILISRVPPPPNAALTDPSLAPLHVASVGVRVRVKVFG